MILRYLKTWGLALTLVAAITLSGAALAGWVSAGVRDNYLYRQSRIIGSVFSQEDVGLSVVLTDARARDTLWLFARALADAYVSFELIPYGEMETFTAVYSSLGPEVEITGFAYHGRNLVITGTAPDKESCLAFLKALQESGHFWEVSGSFDTCEDAVSFKIECTAHEIASFGTRY